MYIVDTKTIRLYHGTVSLIMSCQNYHDGRPYTTVVQIGHYPITLVELGRHVYIQCHYYIVTKPVIIKLESYINNINIILTWFLLTLGDIDKQIIKK